MEFSSTFIDRASAVLFRRFREICGHRFEPPPFDGGDDPFAPRTAPRTPPAPLRSGAVALEEPFEPEHVTVAGRWSRHA